jgi:hypothetical protein
MQLPKGHISDRELLLDSDGEVSPKRAIQIQDHLAHCWSCRSRKAEFEQAVASFIQGPYQSLNDQIPSEKGPRALLKARLTEAAAQERTHPLYRLRSIFLLPYRTASISAMLLLVTSTALFVMLSARLANHHVSEGPEPNAAWTPGAVQLVSREVVCSASEEAELRPITASAAQEVFNRYGIHEPEPLTYEVDYLIPLELGGSEDPHNLWPQPYSAGIWNSHVKDALEDRLRSLVCQGKLDLATAQRDLARDWIAAYKKYFRTNKPLLTHGGFIKDPAWE